MIKRIFFILFLLPALICFSQEEAKVNPIIYPPILSEVVIGIPNLKLEQLISVKTAMQSIAGVSWAGYCEDQHYILLRVDRTLQSDNKNITDKLLLVNNALKLYFKITTFSQALNACADKDKAMLK